MEVKRNFRSGVVLLELMASILIFALAGAICVRVLIRAEEIAAQSRQLNEGVNYASSAAELIRSADSPEEAMALLRSAWPQTQLGEEALVPLGDGVLLISGVENGGIYLYNIVWRVEKDTLYQLELRRWFPEVSP